MPAPLQLLILSKESADQGPPDQIPGSPRNERIRQFLSAMLEAI